jgi:hypothetical protein
MKLGLALLITLFSVALVQEADAQWYPYGARPVRSLDRWLGIGYSAGYHTQNPGPDSDYYQPYSDLNTGLQSWLPVDSGIQPTPAELPNGSPAPSYSPQSLRSPIGPSETRNGLSSRRAKQVAPSGAFGWSSGASRNPQSTMGPVNSGFAGSGQRVSRSPAGNNWR